MKLDPENYRASIGMIEVGDTGTFYHRTVPGGMEAIVQDIQETLDGDTITLYLEDGTEFLVLEQNILNYDEHELEDIAANEQLCIMERDPYESNNNYNSNISTLPPPERTSKRARFQGGSRSTRRRK